MPPASFTTEEIRKAFYDKYKKQLKEKYDNDPEFRAKKLQKRKECYEKHKELGIGRFSPEGIARVNEMRRIRYQNKKAEKLVVTHTL
jgi:hypothetical protein